MRDILLTLIIFGSVPWMLSRPHIGIYIWYWVGLMSPHRFSWGFAYNLPFAQVIAVATLLGILFTKDRKNIPWTAGMSLMVIMYIYMALTSAMAWVPEAAWMKWFDFGKIVLITLLMTTVVHGRNRIHILLLIAALSVGLFGLKGGVFTLLTGGAHRVWGPPGETFISGNNAIGLALIMIIPLLISLGREEQRKWLRQLLYVTAFFSLIATIFTYSRGALVGLAVMIVFATLRVRKLYGLIIIALAVPALTFGPSLLPGKLTNRAQTIENYKEDGSAMERLVSWKIAWRIALDYPTGGGFDYEQPQVKHLWDSYKDPEDELWGSNYHVAHSIYFQTLGQHGFPGLALFMAILLASIRLAQTLQSKGQRNTNTHWIANHAKGIQIGIIGYMAAGAFLNLAWFDLIWLYVGLLALLNRELITSSKALDERSLGTNNLNAIPVRP